MEGLSCFSRDLSETCHLVCSDILKQLNKYIREQHPDIKLDTAKVTEHKKKTPKANPR